jgi:hypothetical protein
MSLLLGYDHGSASLSNYRADHLIFAGSSRLESQLSTKSSFNVIAWIAPGLEQHRVHATCPNRVHCISREHLRCNSSDVLPDRNCESLQTYSISKSWLLLRRCLGTPSAAGPTSLGSLIGRAWGAFPAFIALGGTWRARRGSTKVSFPCSTASLHLLKKAHASRVSVHDVKSLVCSVSPPCYCKEPSSAPSRHMPAHPTWRSTASRAGLPCHPVADHPPHTIAPTSAGRASPPSMSPTSPREVPWVPRAM